MKVRKRFQHNTIAGFKLVDGGGKSYCFDVCHTCGLKGRVVDTFAIGPTSLRDLTTGLIHAGDRSKHITMRERQRNKQTVTLRVRET